MATRNYTLTRPLGHPRERPEGTPVRPRAAATLVIVREGAEGPEVLMGRRHRKAAFIPDAFVFPGGKVDTADKAARPAAPLAEHLPRYMAVRGSAETARALAMTAVRETWEETGLLLGRPGDVGEHEHGTWRELRIERKAPDLSRLDYMGRAITSPFSPIRFHARFFMADAAHFEGTLGGSGELSDLHFTPVRRALADLPIVDVTEFMLQEVERLWRERHDPHRKRPLFAYRLDRPFVKYG